jgi:ribosomal-protein-alanine N-acetyltransferase
MTIRQARLEDLDSIDAIETGVFHSDRLSRRSLRAFIRSNSACLLVAAKRNEILGYSLIGFRKGSHVARLYSIASGVGQKGVGRGLLKTSEKIAMARKCLTLRLEVRADNFRAQDLYERNGYVCFETIEDYYEDGETALRFEKKLKPALKPPLKATRLI